MKIQRLLLNTEIEEYNPGRKRKVLIFFDDMISDMISIIKTQLFIRRRNLSISGVFITQFYFAVQRDVRLKCTHSNNQTRALTNRLQSCIRY